MSACLCVPSSYMSEVGGSEFAFRQAPPKPGNRFVSFVRARGVYCLVGMNLKTGPGRFPFSLCPVEAFVFPVFRDGLSLFP